jgi:hypothetical protein
MLLVLFINPTIDTKQSFNFSRTGSASVEGRPKQAVSSTEAVKFCCSSSNISSFLRLSSVTFLYSCRQHMRF